MEKTKYVERVALLKMFSLPRKSMCPNNVVHIPFTSPPLPLLLYSVEVQQSDFFSN